MTKMGDDRAQATAKMRRDVTSVCMQLAADGMAFTLRYTVRGLKVTLDDMRITE